MAFRSHRNENLQNIEIDPNRNYYRSESNEGNFIGLVKLMAGENMTLAKHIQKCQESAKAGRRNESTFISPCFVNNALFNIRKYLVKSIVNEIVRNGGCFGLLMDGSQDISTKEQISVVVRYINDTNGIVEHTISFFNAKDTSGKAIYETLRKVLAGIGLSLSNVIGCSFDGAQNMRSEAIGVNAYIKQNNINCIYIWCLIHRFNLAVKVATNSERVKCILKIAEDSAKLFRSSHIKMNVWIEVAKSIPNFNSQRRLKLIGTTRWSSKQNAIDSIISNETNLYVLLKALIKLCSVKNLDGDSLANVCANLNAWLEYENVMTTFVLHKIFTLIVPTTKFLQKVGLHIVDGIQSLQNSNQRLEESKARLNNYIVAAEEFIKSTNILLSNDEEIQSLMCDCSIRTPVEIERLEINNGIKTEFLNFIQTLQDETNKKILMNFDQTESIYNEMRFFDPQYTETYLSNGNEPISIKKNM